MFEKRATRTRAEAESLDLASHSRTLKIAQLSSYPRGLLCPVDLIFLVLYPSRDASFTTC